MLLKKLIGQRFCANEDRDVHHGKTRMTDEKRNPLIVVIGNGTQAAFYDDPNTLLISVHVHEDGGFYPLGPYGNHKHCGEGLGLGR